MALLSALLSIIHVLLLLLVPPLTFLWIIGKLKAIRLQNEHHPQEPFPQQPAPHPQPSPNSIPLEPRRLSFSSAATTNTPTPTANPKRRVTFSLTPEQQANELLKTAVRRRESLPSANLLVQHQSPPTQYNPQPQQVAHLFPPQNHPNFRYNPARARTVFPSFEQHPIRAPQHEHPDLKPSNSSSPAVQKRKTSPNKDQTPLPKRQRKPNKVSSRPSSAPVYAADLRRDPEQAKQHHFDTHDPQLNRSRPHEEEVPIPEQHIDNPPSASNASPAAVRFFNAVVKQEPGLKRRRTPPSDRKPPKPPRLVAVPNGFTPQPRDRFQQDSVGAGIRPNGVMSRPVR